MRIAILNWTARKVGGAEQYLDGAIPALARRGHEVAFWSEADIPPERDCIGLPAQAPRWCASESGLDPSLARLREWRPDLLYAHGFSAPAVERRIFEVAPAVLFAHAHYGTCISGTKTFKWPVPVPCSRRFGWQCLAYFYPRRCGGRSPITMARAFRRESRRLKLLSNYRIVLCASSYLEREYRKHGIRCRAIPFCVRQPERRTPFAQIDGAEFQAPRSAWTLLLATRMDELKGGPLLFEALPMAAARLRCRLVLTVAGDGPYRERWESEARRIQATHPEVAIRFIGWTGREALERQYASAELVVIPSICPEGFGLTGPEAASFGAPAAAFSSGGIPEWLTDGFNGHTAPADPPTAQGLADCIVKCLGNAAEYRRLRMGAFLAASRFTLDRHLDALEGEFRAVLGSVTGEANLDPETQGRNA